jgi:hypothetical protein
MKNLLLTLGLIGCALASAVAQGTIAFGNSTSARLGIRASDGPTRLLTAADQITFGAFYGPAGADYSQLVMAPGTATIGPTPGLMINAPSVFALPGTKPGQVVSLQIRLWNDQGLQLETKVAQVTLGSTTGPGAIIWDATSGVNPSRFSPIFIIPEPSTLGLGALAGAFLVFLYRKSYNSN